jgi:O-antigen/teichoic acid export membrane protein
MNPWESCSHEGCVSIKCVITPDQLERIEMNLMPWEAVPVFPWWSYGLAVVGGIGFGFLQLLLLRKSMLGQDRHKWLIAVKFLLWGAALAAVALISVILLLVFTVTATLTLLCGAWLLLRKARKEEK